MNKIHYCPISPIQRQFGLYVTGAGHELTRPGEPYPHEYHSSDYYFTWQKGRALADWEYQLLYIREGRGAIQFKRGKNIPVCAGTVIILHPGEWHRYRPDPNTTTEARDAPFGEFKRPDHADRGRNGLQIAGLLLQILPRPHRAGPFAVPPWNATHRTIIPPLTLEHLRDRPRERPSAVIRFPFSRKHLKIVSLFGGNHTTSGSTKDERTGHRGNRQNERDRPCLASNTLMLIYRRL